MVAVALLALGQPEVDREARHPLALVRLRLVVAVVGALPLMARLLAAMVDQAAVVAAT